jgi:hypothetical protein
MRLQTSASAMALFLISGLYTQALADWEYTRWGMTPEQVAAASFGKIRVLPKGERQAGADDHSEIAAEGVYPIDGHTLAVGLQFDTRTNGLTCVLYNGSGDDVALIRDMLVAKYGKTEETSLGEGYSMEWKTPELIDFAVHNHPLTGAVIHCQTGRE